MRLHAGGGTVATIGRAIPVSRIVGVRSANRARALPHRNGLQKARVRHELSQRDPVVLYETESRR